MGRKRKGAIPTQKAPPKQEDKKIVVLENDFTIDFFYKKWMGSTGDFYSKNNFTNCLSSMEEFENNMMIILMEYFPKIYKDYEAIFNVGQRYSNCHPVPQEKLNFLVEVVKRVHNEDVKEVDFESLNNSGYEWWYLGFKQSLRVVGLYNKANNKFLPMMIDHHHLIHENQHYNLPDYKKYSFCPVTNYEQSSS